MASHSLPQICESWTKSDLMQMRKPCHYALVEAVEPFNLNPITSYTYIRCSNAFLRLWMGTWHRIHSVTTTDPSPDLWKLADILPNASVHTMPLHFGCGCRTFQMASHVHVIHIWGVWAPSQIVDEHMASHSYCYCNRCFPRLGKVGWNPTSCKCANHANTLWLRL